MEPRRGPRLSDPFPTTAVQLVPFCFWLPTDPRQGSAVPQKDRRLPTAGSTAVAPAAASAARGGGGRPAGDPEPQSCPGPGLPELQLAMARQLAAQGHAGALPLRWAITAVDPQRGLCLEGIGVTEAGATAPGSLDGDVRAALPSPSAGSADHSDHSGHEADDGPRP